MANRENSDIIKGSSLMVFMKQASATGSSVAPIAFSTSHNFNKSLQSQEIACKDFGDYTAVIPQTIAWEATTENLYSVDGWNKVNDAFDTKKEVIVAFGPASNYSASVTETQQGIVGNDRSNWTPAAQGATGLTSVQYGRAYITSLQVTAAAGDNATFTATFTGNGELSYSDPTQSPTSPTGTQSVL